MKRIGLALAMLGSGAMAAPADDAARMARVALGRVRVARGYLLRDDRPGCPEAGKTCRARAYVVRGDPVLLDGTKRGFLQVRYANRLGWPTVGLLPEAEVTRVAVPPQRWTGHWVRVEAKIDLKRTSASGFAISGDATWGSLDPERVRRGGVNVGEFEGALRPRGTGVVAITGTGDDPDACRVWVRLLGPYLLVTDNDACGGHNVSFTGVYRRAG